MRFSRCLLVQAHGREPATSRQRSGSAEAHHEPRLRSPIADIRVSAGARGQASERVRERGPAGAREPAARAPTHPPTTAPCRVCGDTGCGPRPVLHLGDRLGRRLRERQQPSRRKTSAADGVCGEDLGGVDVASGMQACGGHREGFFANQCRGRGSPTPGAQSGRRANVTTIAASEIELSRLPCRRA
jgi:hypothetical protein